MALPPTRALTRLALVASFALGVPWISISLGACGGTTPDPAVPAADGSDSADNSSGGDDLPGPVDSAPTHRSRSTAATAGSANENIPNHIRLVPHGMRWRMSREDLEALVDSFIEEDYQPKLAKATGREIDDLMADREAKKRGFHRSYIDLKPGPLGLDTLPICQEYVKGKDEGLLIYDRGPGVRLYFFLVHNKLWKTYEEVRLEDGGLYGKDILSAAEILIGNYCGGMAPKFTPPDESKGQMFGVNEWQDADTHMRVFQTSNTTLAVVREDRATLSGSSDMLPHVCKDDFNKKSTVGGYIRNGDPDAPPPLPSASATSDKKKKHH